MAFHLTKDQKERWFAILQPKKRNVLTNLFARTEGVSMVKEKDEMDFFYFPRNVQLRMEQNDGVYVAQVYRHTMTPNSELMETDLVGVASDENRYTALGKAMYKMQQFLISDESH